MSLFRKLISKINPDTMLIGGLFGMPMGGLFGGYYSITDIRPKNIIEGIIAFNCSVATGVIVGGIVGATLPVSLPSYGLFCIYEKYIKK